MIAFQCFYVHHNVFDARGDYIEIIPWPDLAIYIYYDTLHKTLCRTVLLSCPLYNSIYSNNSCNIYTFVIVNIYISCTKVSVSHEIDTHDMCIEIPPYMYVVEGLS